jgi:hypothetical protein
MGCRDGGPSAARALIIPGLLLAFTIYCLVDVIRSEDSDVRGLPKLVWVLLVLLFPLAGGVAWFIVGRPRASRLPGTERLGRPKPRALGPDDDPDFLRDLGRQAPPVVQDGDEPRERGTGAGPEDAERDDDGDGTASAGDRH